MILTPLGMDTDGERRIAQTGDTISKSFICTTGTATLSGGTVTVLTTAVTASSVILVTSNFVSNLSTGVLSVTNLVVGTSFKVTSNNGLDVQPFTWCIIG